MTYREHLTAIYYTIWRLGLLLLTLLCMVLRDAAMYVGNKANGWAEDGHRQVARLAEVGE